ncbi:proline racemase family protein [Brevibacterium sp. UCMA 11754]|uniref:proline racemase family protein n=1 Tax=Brevibacterium sp. UCMA 11754 TaxID=2749198 RepID=UPI001F26DE85|nr:proline racemase family protein [Brevibacterium sp. UCMA 11754]MCF2570592.1 proline racemase family protein [Brevibacterium sp. UCMA 11754]
MRTNRLIQTVEAHTEGLPVRVVTGGSGTFPGATMAERREWFIANSDELRTFLMCEPRGSSCLSGAILQPPTHSDADWGVLFIEVTGVLPMCGAGTIAVATVLVETGMVTVEEPVTTVRLDTPIGLITADVAVHDGRAESVTIVNVPSYAHALDQIVDVPGRGELACDIGFGGNFYAFVNAAEVAIGDGASDGQGVGIPFERDRAEDFIAAGRDVMAAVNEQMEPVHPESGYRGCEHVVFLAPGSDSGQSSLGVRHVLINAPGWLDRSPGGTGTSALMAVRHARGELELNTDFTNESFIGTSFTGRLVDETNVAEHAGVIPTITGSAWITGTAHYTLDPSDPFPAGFTL